MSSWATHQALWRVSVASYNRVVFPHPQTESPMLALERKATASGEKAHIRAQPFGGGVRILDPAPLQELIGEIRYDSERSQSEQDFRILIPPAKWETVKDYCLHHLANPGDRELEASPQRELTEEFEEAVGIHFEPDQYAVLPMGFVIEDNPAPTKNARAPGQLTVRLYRTFEVRILDSALCAALLDASQRYTDRELKNLALRDSRNGGRGRANSILVLPLSAVREAYLALGQESRFTKLEVNGHQLDESVLAILHEVDVPQYQRL